jgi:hypothetical protein
MQLGMDIIEANNCPRHSYPLKTIYDDSHLPEALGAAPSPASSEQPETLAEQAAQRLAGLRAAKDVYHILSDMAAAQEQAEMEEEALLEGTL